MKKHKRHVYADNNLPCDFPGCGRHFMAPQGLRGHKRMIHGIRDKTTIPDPELLAGQAVAVTKSSEATIKDLTAEVATLKLEKQKRQLQAEFPLVAPGPGDLMQQAGLGSLEGEAKILAQKRAMGITDSSPAQGWLDKLLSNPEGLKVAIAGVRGILDINNHGGGDGTATLLKDLGFSLKDLILNSTAPKAGALSIGGLDITGANLTPELIGSLIEYKGKTEAAEKDYQARKMMTDTLASAVETIGKSLSQGLLRRGGSISQDTIERTAVAPVDNVITCPKCKTENQLPADLAPGQRITCQGEGCEESWLAVDDQAKAKPKQERQKKEVEVEEPEAPESNCPGCGQLLDIAGKGIGDVVVCPICQEEFTIKSEDTAIKTEEPDPYGINTGREFLRSSPRFGRP